MRGYFAIGIINGKNAVNTGMLWRTAHAFGANFIFTIGNRYPKRAATDTTDAARHIPLIHYSTFDELPNPKGCDIIGVELVDSSISLPTYKHPERAIYLLGAEDSGIPQEVMDRLSRVIQIPGKYCLNVAIAGSIIMYDRVLKNK